LACGLFAVSLEGCATLAPKLEAPEICVSRIEMLKGDFLQQTLRVTLHARNPNRVDLPVRGIQCDVEVAGERFAHGESEKEFVLPARGEADFDLAVTANGAGAVLRILGGAVKGGQLEYRMSGRVELRSLLFRSLPFEQKGRVDLKQGLFSPGS
jgi:LEA14-like dessication related protein